MRIKPIRFTCRLDFGIADVHSLTAADRRELRDFIKEALECWGGQRHPEDWLFRSLDKVVVTGIERKS